MACGKPVVATCNGGSEEIIVDKKLGILVEAGDVNGLAKAMLKALDRDWNAGYILNYADQFKWNNVAERIAILYKDVLAEHG